MIETLAKPRFLPLGGSEESTAISSADDSVSYGELWARAHALSNQWGERELVSLELANDIDSVVAYVAVLIGNHVGILSGERQQGLQQAVAGNFQPTIRAGSRGWSRLGLDAPALHPDLRLLLSTSGSTGSAKLVRISDQNLSANTGDILHELQLGPSDVTMSTLPLFYCYGLSVLNSHLAAGAQIRLGDWSVADTCFWDEFNEVRPTTLAGVPYTLDLLATANWRSRDLDRLRLVTVAGGAIPEPERPGLYEFARARGIEVMSMYGQTEATARMGVLPSSDYRPGRTARALASGAFSLDESVDPRPGVGEVLFSGPNVMMGYAQTAQDLLRPAETTVLRTGDLGSLDGDWLSLRGRSADFAKIGGIRLDLGRLATSARKLGLEIAADDLGSKLGLLVVTDSVSMRTSQLLSDLTGLPQSFLRIQAAQRLPRTARGKLDRDAVRAQLSEPDTNQTATEPVARDSTETIALIYEDVLALPKAPDPGLSFLDLRGDSLSYVATATRLGRLGEVPLGWQKMPIQDLAGSLTPHRGVAQGWLKWPAVDLTIVVRAVSIVLIVMSHMGMVELVGGSQLLLVVAGLNLAAFQLQNHERRQAITSGARSLGRIVLPALLWLVPLWLFVSEYSASVLLVNNLVGPVGDSPEWQYWFLESIIVILALTLAIVALPGVWQLWQRRPSVVASGLLGLAILWLLLVDRPLDGPGELFTPAVAAWFFAFGVAIWTVRDRSWAAKAVLQMTLIFISVFYFDNPTRAGVVVVGVTLLIWLPTVRLPRWLIPAVSVVATASLGIYLTHYQIYPLFGEWHLLGLAAALLFGIGYWYAVKRLLSWVRLVWERRHGEGETDAMRSRPSPRSTSPAIASR